MIGMNNSQFGDIIVWDKLNHKFIVIRNYKKFPNLLKFKHFEFCCMALGNGKFISLNESKDPMNWHSAFKYAKEYDGVAPIKSYLPSIDELKFFHPLIPEFKSRVDKLNCLGIECCLFSHSIYWSSTEFSSSGARILYTFDGNVDYDNKYNYYFYVRAFLAF